MPQARGPLRVGLTGGIASGKSTVARRLAELGAFVVDADHLARLVTEPPGDAFRQIVERFGAAVVGADGRLDRAALGARVFSDPDARADLNAIVHPAVRAEAERSFRERAGPGGPALLVFDAALLVETGAWRDFDRLVVVHCSRGTQVERLARRDGMSRADAEARIDSQAPAADKIALADHVLDTDAPLEDTLADVERLYRELLGAAARRVKRSGRARRPPRSS